MYQAPRRISQKIRRLIRKGDWQGEYTTSDSPSDDGGLATAIALGMANANRPKDEFYEALMNPRNKCSQWYWSLVDQVGPERANKRLDNIWTAAERRVQACPPRKRITSKVDAYDLAERVLSYGARVLTGRTSATDLAVLAVWKEQALKYETESPVMPVHTIAMRASMSATTACKALQRLVDAGVLVRVPRRNRANTYGCPPSGIPANVYRPTSRALLHTSGTDVPVIRLGGQMIVSSDAIKGERLWRHDELGRSALLVYGQLDSQEGSTAKELAARTGKHPSTVYRKLNALERGGLAEKVGNEWLLGKADPVEVARLEEATCPDPASPRRAGQGGEVS